MCNQLRHSHWANRSPVTPGSFFPSNATVLRQIDPRLFAEQVQGPIRWNGFACSETLSDKFPPHLWDRGELLVEGYSEKSRDYIVRPGKAIQVVLRKMGSRTYLSVVTRPAEGDAEASVHGRWPLVRTRRLIPPLEVLAQ